MAARALLDITVWFDQDQPVGQNDTIIQDSLSRRENQRMLERLFRLKENGTTARTELLAGLSTFLTMAYTSSFSHDR
jgi:hypothetical protein